MLSDAELEESGVNTSDERCIGVSHLPTKKRAFLAIAIVLGTVLFIIEAVLWYADVSSLYIFLIELAELIVTVAFLLVVVKYVVQKSYSFALYLFLVTVFMTFAFPAPSKLFLWFESRDVMHLIYADEAAYHVKFSLHEKQYLEEIKLVQPDQDGFRYKEFNWGRGAADWTGLVYDESDEFDLPEASRSKAWWAKVGGHLGILSCPYDVHKIKSHFFVVSATCLNYQT